MKEIEERVEDAMREFGVLLVAFAPLDVVLTHGVGSGKTALALFFGLGMSSFLGALILERRRFKQPVGRKLLISMGFGLCLLVGAFVMGVAKKTGVIQ